MDAAPRWEFDMEKGNAYRPERAPDRFAVDSCGRCHSAGENFADPRPDLLLTDYRRPTLLRAPHYFPDGQIRGEVYSWGSFLQSRMYHEGVVCGDCHDAHGLTTPGDLACAKCHLASQYQNRRHHGHRRGQGGDSCVDCHMPARTYWQVDVRHDHSLRIPRPDLSAKLGTPNTCTGCHPEKDDAWAMRSMDQWYGKRWRERPEWGTALAGQEPAALRTLLNDGRMPAIVRATAAVLLAETVGGAAAADLDAVATEDPLLRQGLERARAALD